MVLSASFDARLYACDPELRQLLKDKVSVIPLVFAQITRGALGSEDTKRVFHRLLTGLKVRAEVFEKWTEDCADLHVLAHTDAPEIVQRVALLTGCVHIPKGFKVEGLGPGS